MSASCPVPRLSRLAVFAVAGATVLSLSACGSSNNSNSASTSTSTSTSVVTSTTTSATPNAEARVSGLIASVAGNSIQVTKEDNATASVNFTSTTKITEAVPAGLPDVTPGSCVSAKPTQASAPGQPVTAATVMISESVNGACPKPPQSAPGGSTTTPPSLPPSPAPAKPAWVRGSVASVSGNTINLTNTDPSGNTTQTTVTVDDKTKYSKQSSANTDAITPGKCLSARGTQDNGGALQATSIKLRQAVDGKCGKPKQPGQGG
jgi:hypothetical protein